jgi:hypothetical protein
VLESRVRSALVRACGPLAQLAEQQTLNLRVVGSIPTRLTTQNKRLRLIGCGRILRLWLRGGCVEMRRRIIETVDSRPVRPRNQMAPPLKFAIGALAPLCAVLSPRLIAPLTPDEYHIRQLAVSRACAGVFRSGRRGHRRSGMARGQDAAGYVRRFIAAFYFHLDYYRKTPICLRARVNRWRPLVTDAICRSGDRTRRPPVSRP